MSVDAFRGRAVDVGTLLRRSVQAHVHWGMQQAGMQCMRGRFPLFVVLWRGWEVARERVLDRSD